MKYLKIWLICILLLTFFTGMVQPANEGFEINSEIIGLDSGTAILGFSSKERYYPLNLVEIENGKFQFKGTLGSPRQLSIQLLPGNYIIYFYAGDEEVKITGDIKDVENFLGRTKLNVEVTGSRMHDEMAAFEKLQEPIQKQLKPLQSTYDRLNKLYKEAKRANRPDEEVKELLARAEATRGKIKEAKKSLEKIKVDYIRKNPDSHISSSFFIGMTRNHTYSENMEIFESFSPEVKNGFYGKQIELELEKLARGPEMSNCTINCSKKCCSHPDRETGKCLCAAKLTDCTVACCGHDK